MNMAQKIVSMLDKEGEPYGLAVELVNNEIYEGPVVAATDLMLVIRQTTQPGYEHDIYINPAHIVAIWSHRP